MDNHNMYILLDLLGIIIISHVKFWLKHYEFVETIYLPHHLNIKALGQQRYLNNEWQLQFIIIYLLLLYENFEQLPCEIFYDFFSYLMLYTIVFHFNRWI